MKFSLFLFLIFILFTVTSCSKENNPNWEVQSIGIVPTGNRLILIHNNDFSDVRPYELGQGVSSLVWEENQILPPSGFRNVKCIKQFLLEIPDSSSNLEFSYSDEEIYNNLKCCVYHYYKGQHDGYYRIHKGNITFKNLNGTWIVNFKVYYGGKKNDKFKMVSGADY